MAGANETGYHLRNVNYGRDYQAQIVTDIAAAQEGDACPRCGGALRTVRGVEVGNIFKLGTRYSDAMGCTYLDRDGQEKPVIMGSYGIGSGRLLACVAEQHHDENGLIWPVSVAPYHVHLVALAGKGNTETTGTRRRPLRRSSKPPGCEVLYDDREESPGVKFNDADLIGLPLRLTVSERAHKAGGVELKRRDQAEKRIIAHEKILETVQAEIAGLREEIQARVVDVPFDEG